MWMVNIHAHPLCTCVLLNVYVSCIRNFLHKKCGCFWQVRLTAFNINHKRICTAFYKQNLVLLQKKLIAWRTSLSLCFVRMSTAQRFIMLGMYFKNEGAPVLSSI